MSSILFRDGGAYENQFNNIGIIIEFLFRPPQPSTIKRSEVMLLLKFVFCRR